MTTLYKNTSKSDLIDKVNDTHCHLYEIFANAYPDISKNVASIYPKELTLNTATYDNTSCPFLYSNVSVSWVKIKIIKFATRGTTSNSLM